MSQPPYGAPGYPPQPGYPHPGGPGLVLPPPPPSKRRTIGLWMGLLTALALVGFVLLVLIVSKTN